jgi:2-isopropylmalate synthase
MVRIQDRGILSVGRASHEDIIVASAKAYINALNRLEKLGEEKREWPTL